MALVVLAGAQGPRKILDTGEALKAVTLTSARVT